MPRRTLAGLLLPLVPALLGACGDDPPTQAELDRFFDAKAYSTAACNEKDLLLSGRREMRLYQSGRGDLVASTQGLQRYYRRHGLTFFTEQRPESIALTYALDTDEVALGRALTKKFPGVDFNDEASLKRDPAVYDEVMKYVANFMFRPMIQFARAHKAGAGVTNFVLLPQLVRPGGIEIGPKGATLAGLAISAPLLQIFTANNPEESKIWQDVDLPEGFSPMMFLDEGTLHDGAAESPVIRDLVVAHEFGHTGGLVHRPESHNLMYPSVTPGANTCADGLTDDQFTTLRATFGFGPQVKTLTVEPGARIPGRDRLYDPLTPAQLKRLLHGDPEALRTLLAPLL
jgi:hypothetical protein